MKTTMPARKEIEPFKPIDIPIFEKRVDLRTISAGYTQDTNCNNKEI